MSEQLRIDESVAVARPFPNPRALVVDDDEDIRKMLSLALHRIGFEVLEAGNGVQAYEMFLDVRFDLVVTDLQMPLMDGLALIEKLKRHSPGTPVVLVTGQWPPRSINQPTSPGISNVCTILLKPFALSEFQRAARNALHASIKHGIISKGEHHESH